MGQPIALEQLENTHRPRKMLFAASTGGHLAQLVRLSNRMNASPDSLWVTFDSAQSRSLLAGRRVKYVRYISQRDWRGVLGGARAVRSLLRTETFDHAVSTGAALALAVLPVARLRGIPATYVESVSRVDGPSLTGRLLERTPGINLRTQHASWAGTRWRKYFSVLAEYEAVDRPAVERPSIFVTLGTLEKYRFDSLVDAVLSTGLADERTVWQIGATDRADLPGSVFKSMPSHELATVAQSADVVISHAGVGSLLQLLELGVYPVLAIRRSERSEHIDDHQEQIARFANAAGIAMSVEAPDVTASVIRSASGRRTKIAK